MTDTICRLLIITLATSLVATPTSFADEGSGAASYLMLEDTALTPPRKASDEKPEDAPKAMNKGSADGVRKQSSRQKPDIAERTVRTYIAYETAGNQVSTRCFPPELKVVLAKVQQRYGTRPIVNSGYRSSSKNRRVGGARLSYHIKCMAADIKVPGVSKYSLAKYLKSVSGVGGVGTYGCNNFVHVDVGPKRTWNWGCSSRGRRA